MQQARNNNVAITEAMKVLLNLNSFVRTNQSALSHASDDRAQVDQVQVAAEWSAEK